MLNRQLQPWRPLVSILRPPIFQKSIRRFSIPSSKTSDAIRPFQASILFRAHQQPSSDALIASIMPLDATITTTNHAPIGQAILLFTPSFAQSLAYNPQFLFNVVNRLYHDVQKKSRFNPSEKIQIAVAVVDRLPFPTRSATVKLRSINPPVDDNGCEGMCYLVSDASILDITPTLPDAQLSNQDQLRTLTLRIGRSGCATSNFEIQVPLASTVFQAGQPYLLSHTQWQWIRDEATEGATLRQTGTSSLSHVSFNWPFPFLGDIPELSTAVSIPLQPLTSAREIMAGMGNVIRQIDGDGKPIPASQELESSVNAYFTARQLPPSSVSVWALIFPPSLYHTLRDSKVAKRKSILHSLELNVETLRKTWQTEPPRWSKYLYPMLSRGARLHRVVSGGGGWGNKAGLLSLDPESDFKATSTADLSAKFAASDILEAQEGMLGSVAKIGDFVQFYIAPSHYNHEPVPSNSLSESGWTMDVGTIPSTIDDIPITPPLDDAQSLNTAVTVPNHFGLLSEKGIAVNILNDETKGAGTWTKMTTPYTRWSFQKQFSLLEQDDEGQLESLATGKLLKQTEEKELAPDILSNSGSRISENQQDGELPPWMQMLSSPTRLIEPYSKLRMPPHQPAVKVRKLSLKEPPIESNPEISSDLQTTPTQPAVKVRRIYLKKSPIESYPEISSNLQTTLTQPAISVKGLSLKKPPVKSNPEISSNLRMTPTQPSVEVGTPIFASSKDLKAEVAELRGALSLVVEKRVKSRRWALKANHLLDQIAKSNDRQFPMIEDGLMENSVPERPARNGRDMSLHRDRPSNTSAPGSTVRKYYSIRLRIRPSHNYVRRLRKRLDQKDHLSNPSVPRLRVRKYFLKYRPSDTSLRSKRKRKTKREHVPKDNPLSSSLPEAPIDSGPIMRKIEMYIPIKRDLSIRKSPLDLYAAQGWELLRRRRTRGKDGVKKRMIVESMERKEEDRTGSKMEMKMPDEGQTTSSMMQVQPERKSGAKRIYRLVRKAVNEGVSHPRREVRIRRIEVKRPGMKLIPYGVPLVPRATLGRYLDDKPSQGARDMTQIESGGSVDALTALEMHLDETSPGGRKRKRGVTSSPRMADKEREAIMVLASVKALLKGF